MTKSEVLSLLSVKVSASGVFCPCSAGLDASPSEDEVSSRLVTTIRSGSTSKLVGLPRLVRISAS